MSDDLAVFCSSLVLHFIGCLLTQEARVQSESDGVGSREQYPPGPRAGQQLLDDDDDGYGRAGEIVLATSQGALLLNKRGFKVRWLALWDVGQAETDRHDIGCQSSEASECVGDLWDAWSMADIACHGIGSYSRDEVSNGGE